VRAATERGEGAVETVRRESGMAFHSPPPVVTEDAMEEGGFQVTGDSLGWRGEELVGG
jgi:hypothetical protein